jgi:hypothetical protein
MGVLKSIKKSWVNYLSKQAEANKRNFGTTEGLSCCNLQKYDELGKEPELKSVDGGGEAETQREKNPPAST